jgi:hypothetical protein
MKLAIVMQREHSSLWRNAESRQLRHSASVAGRSTALQPSSGVLGIDEFPRPFEGVSIGLLPERPANLHHQLSVGESGGRRRGTDDARCTQDSRDRLGEFAGSILAYRANTSSELRDGPVAFRPGPGRRLIRLIRPGPVSMWSTRRPRRGRRSCWTAPRAAETPSVNDGVSCRGGARSIRPPGQCRGRSGGGVAGLGGALPVGGMDRFVVADTTVQAVPEDFQPAVAEGAQSSVVTLAALHLGRVERSGPAGAPQRAERPVLDGVAEEVVVGLPAADDVLAAAGASGDRCLAGVALQRVR